MRHQVARWAETVTAPVWEPVTLRGSGVPWMGLSFELDLRRPWVWEVVTPEVCDRHRELRDDPLVLVCERDVVLCELSTGERRLTMHVPVSSAPRQLLLPPEAIPPGWELRLDAVWSRQAVHAAVDTWALLECGRTVEWGPGDTGADPQQRFEVGDGVYATDGAMDVLLGERAEVSASVTEVFAAVVEALGDHVERRPGR